MPHASPLFSAELLLYTRAGPGPELKSNIESGTWGRLAKYYRAPCASLSRCPVRVQHAGGCESPICIRTEYEHRHRVRDGPPENKRGKSKGPAPSRYLVILLPLVCSLLLLCHGSPGRPSPIAPPFSIDFPLPCPLNIQHFNENTANHSSPLGPNFPNSFGRRMTEVSIPHPPPFPHHPKVSLAQKKKKKDSCPPFLRAGKVGGECASADPTLLRYLHLQIARTVGSPALAYHQTALHNHHYHHHHPPLIPQAAYCQVCLVCRCLSSVRQFCPPYSSRCKALSGIVGDQTFLAIEIGIGPFFRRGIGRRSSGAWAKSRLSLDLLRDSGSNLTFAVTSILPRTLGTPTISSLLTITSQKPGTL
ncbi:uncharacterized protein LY79DRAFT_50049 [Colletotrichum navitas]|uniref:Uncharacterized protein n=1 Tax=Colletotrichum navitas TaxID=681940 RepID=A0AAD8V870_9PEZI|nr:uncharacterized protein LY79DRAFT_50049 [Colletotrichum navitas]KAK1596629.1 hypothetical protein LY79DRAFT_50049 [Colletotrichum navitas]